MASTGKRLSLIHIFGPSGAGKTTMCNLVARFWDVNAGKITIGGTDVRDFKLDLSLIHISYDTD